MATTTRKEARHRYQRPPRHAETGYHSLTPTARESLAVLLAVAFCLCVTWGMAAMYQGGFDDGYVQAKAAQHG